MIGRPHPEYLAVATILRWANVMAMAKPRLGPHERTLEADEFARRHR